MATLLHLQTSLFGTEGKSSQLAQRYIQRWQAAHPGGELLERDLINDPVPHMDVARMQVLRGFAGEDLDAGQQAILAQSDALIAELKAADTVLIGVPMYNFHIPTQLKAWFDHLARAGVTFSYGEKGPVGLIQGKKVILLASRGGMYKDQGADFQIPYMTQMLGFLGMLDVEVVYAEGLAMGEQGEQSLQTAQQAIDALPL